MKNKSKGFNIFLIVIGVFVFFSVFRPSARRCPDPAPPLRKGGRKFCANVSCVLFLHIFYHIIMTFAI